MGYIEQSEEGPRTARRIVELEDQLMEAGKAAMKIQAQFEQQTERATKLQKAWEAAQDIIAIEQRGREEANAENAKLTEREAELLGHIETLELQICRFKTSNARLREALEPYANDCGCAAGCRRCERAKETLSRQASHAQPCFHGNIGACAPCDSGCTCPGKEQNLKIRVHALQCPAAPVQGCDFHGCYGSVTGLHHSACRLAAVCPDCSNAMSPAFDQGQGVYFCFGCHKRKAPQAAQVTFPLSALDDMDEPQTCFDHGSDLDPRVSSTCPRCKSGEDTNG